MKDIFNVIILFSIFYLIVALISDFSNAACDEYDIVNTMTKGRWDHGMFREPMWLEPKETTKEICVKYHRYFSFIK